MDRYKWYRLGLPITQAQLVSQLLKLKFTPQVDSGFVYLGSERDDQNFRFAWRSYLSKTSFDERGHPQIELISNVNFSDFCIFKKNQKLWLRLNNPPRSSRELLNALEGVIGLGFSVDPVVFSNATLLKGLTKISESRLIGFKASGALAKQPAVARLEVASKEGMQLDQLEILKEMKYTLDSATYDLVFKRTKGQIAFSSNGLLKISGQLSPLLLSLVETNLIGAKAN